MQELLFRGQTRKFGEYKDSAGNPLPANWVYGGVFQGALSENGHSIIHTDNGEKIPVYTDTLGQYIRQTDKNSTKIFSGDIIRGKNKRLFYIDYSDKAAMFVARTLDDNLSCPCLNYGTLATYEVVGYINKIAKKYIEIVVDDQLIRKGRS